MTYEIEDRMLKVSGEGHLKILSQSSGLLREAIGESDLEFSIPDHNYYGIVTSIKIMLDDWIDDDVTGYEIDIMDAARYLDAVECVMGRVAWLVSEGESSQGVKLWYILARYPLFFHISSTGVKNAGMVYHDANIETILGLCGREIDELCNRLHDRDLDYIMGKSIIKRLFFIASTHFIEDDWVKPPAIDIQGRKYKLILESQREDLYCGVALFRIDTVDRIYKEDITAVLVLDFFFGELSVESISFVQDTAVISLVPSIEPVGEY